MKRVYTSIQRLPKYYGQVKANKKKIKRIIKIHQDLSVYVKI